MLDQDSLRRFEARCTEENPPLCRVHCPFAFDCRAFLQAMAKGALTEARKLIELYIPLPGILALLCDHPCEQACLRRDFGGSLALHGLELACILATERRDRRLPIPPKRFRLAVLGAGLAGLTAAWDLAKKAYPVTLFHQGDLTESLCARYPLLKDTNPNLPIDKLLAADLDLLQSSSCTLTQATLDAALVEQVSQDFDGLLIDADAASTIAPAERDCHCETLLWRDKIVCAGFAQKSPTGHIFYSPAKQAGEGRCAAQTLERLVAGRSLTAERNRAQTPVHTDCSEVSISPRIEPSQLCTEFLLPLYTQEEAKTEAARCLHCDCRMCVRNCVYLQKYNKYPRLYARQIHNNAAIVKGLHTANALINGCTLCGQCTELCPERFSMAELCLAAREDMVANGTMPPSAHEFALEDMEQASGAESFLVQPDPAVDKPNWLFFPGCQLVAARGKQVIALYTWLQKALRQGDKPGLALLLSCCGQPAFWAGRKRLFAEHGARLTQAWEDLGKPEILTACSSCLAAMHTLGLPARSVWESIDGFDQTELNALAALGTGNAPSLPKRFSLHDPCTARQNKAWQKAVRSLLGKRGYTFEEPKLTAETTACCGYGGLVWCAQPDTAKALTEARAAQFTYPGLASCSMCRDRFVASGKECWHLLDALLPKLAHNGNEKGPGLDERRQNRIRVRAEILGEKPRQKSSILSLTPTMIARLEEEHILLTDLEESVQQIEAQGKWCENRANGHRLGSWRPRKVTFWLEYSPCDTGFILHDAWCHRMIVPGSGCQDAEGVIKEQQCCTDGGRRERK